jgi:ABC-type transport system involved in cytochrome bd biosynthesis fused ATPase/permease subunit
MVLDEPSEGLDESEARDLLSEVRRHQSTGVVVVISHQQHDHARATTHLFVEGGRVLEMG